MSSEVFEYRVLEVGTETPALTLADGVTTGLDYDNSRRVVIWPDDSLVDLQAALDAAGNDGWALTAAVSTGANSFGKPVPEQLLFFQRRRPG